MQLFIDSGNTKTKVALYSSALGFFKNWDFLNTEAEIQLPVILEAHAKDIKTSLICCVSNLKSWIESSVIKYKISYILLNNQTPIPISIHYKSPDTLGIDRLALAVGAHALCSNKKILVLSFGSCITYNYIENNAFIGGAISPGLSQRFEVLNQKTAQLPKLFQKKTTSFLGTDTNTSIYAGVMHGARLEVQGFIQEYIKNKGVDSIIFTGGDAFYFEDVIKNSTFVEPNLLMLGLKCILDYNTK